MTDQSADQGEAARYAVVSARVGALYDQEEYAAALAVIRAERGSLPTYGSDLAHLAACLHALAGNPAAALRDLQGAAADGAWWHPRLLVAVDSSQLSTPTYRTWPDTDAATVDIAAALATLSKADRELPVVAGGFSAGARAALLWALGAEPTPVAGVVALALAVWREQTSGAIHQPVGVVVIGADDDLLPTSRDALEHLPGVRLEVVDGVAHGYPDDFDTWLPPALDEVLPQP